jgi:PAS domain-containing protein
MDGVLIIMLSVLFVSITLFLTLKWQTNKIKNKTYLVTDKIKRSKYDSLKTLEKLAKFNFYSMTNLEQMLDLLSDGVVAIKNNQVIYANPAFVSLTGYQPGDLINKTMEELGINTNVRYEPGKKDIERITHCWYAKNGKPIEIDWTFIFTNEYNMCYGICHQKQKETQVYTNGKVATMTNGHDINYNFKRASNE